MYIAEVIYMEHRAFWKLNRIGYVEVRRYTLEGT